jgi:cytochrome c556
MKTLRIAFALGMGILGGVLLAQTESDFQGWMKQIAASNGKLKGAVGAKDGAAITAEAKTFESTFKQVEAFFKARNMPGAAKMAADVHQAATATIAAVAANNLDAAATASAGMTGSCAGCHGAYREKAGDGYKIKQ